VININQAKSERRVWTAVFKGMSLSIGIVTSTFAGLFNNKITIALGSFIVGILLIGIPEFWAVLYFSSGIFKEWLTESITFFQSFDFTIAVASLALIAAILYRLWKRELPFFPINNGVLAMLLFTVYMVFSLLYTNSFLYGGTKTVSFITFNWVAFIIPIMIITDARKAKSILTWIVLLALIISCYTIFTISKGLVQRQLLTSVRASFLGVNPISFAGWLGVAGVIVFSMMQSIKSNLKIIALICLGIIFFAMLAANSRGPFISFASTIILILGLRYWKTAKMKLVFGFFFITAFIIILFQVLPPEMTSRYLDVAESQPIPKRMTLFTVNERLFFWQIAFMTPFDNVLKFLFGVGIGGFSDVAVGYDVQLYPHNIFLEIFCELGFIGLILFLLFLSITFGEIIRNLRGSQNSQARALSFASTMAAIFTLMGALFSGDLNDNRRLWFLLGLGMAMSRLSEINKKPQPVSSHG